MLTEISVDGLTASFPPSLVVCHDRCHECRDIGFSIVSGEIRECFRLNGGVAHNGPTPGGTVLRRCSERLLRKNIVPDTHHFLVARRLAEFSKDRPCDTRQLLDQLFGFSKDPLRKFTDVVEQLRRVWLLPVGSRRGRPAGYWIITEAGDFAEWVNRAKQAPITQLTTIHRVARHNFPIFAEQLELEFWADITPED